ncbi:MAG: ABC transporter substrate-binding protein, partial [Pseudomonadales bacterium]|nr:ABC transporter substrate-binding protein [Pseudomonadales bacterium]
MSWTMLLAVMLVVFVAAQPVQAEQRPDTLLRETVDQLLDELSNNRQQFEDDKCQLYSVVNRLVLPLFAIDKITRLILGKHFKAVSPEMRNRFSRA